MIQCLSNDCADFARSVSASVPHDGSAFSPDRLRHVTELLSPLFQEPAQAVIALDFDGTLAPIVDDPAQARAHPQAASALRRLAPLVRSIVIITGRPALIAVEYGGF